MNIIRKSATCQGHPPESLLNIDNTILNNLNLDNLPSKPTKNIKKFNLTQRYSKPPNLYLDELDIDFSDSDSSTSSKPNENKDPMVKHTPIKVYKGNIIKRRINESPVVSKKSKFHDDHDLFEDSFECFEDTQVLLQKTKPIKDSSNISSTRKVEDLGNFPLTNKVKETVNFPLTSKVHTRLSQDIFVSQQIIDNRNDPFESFIKQRNGDFKTDSSLGINMKMQDKSVLHSNVDSSGNSLLNHKSSILCINKKLYCNESRSGSELQNEEMDEFKWPERIETSSSKQASKETRILAAQNLRIKSESADLNGESSRYLESRNKSEPVLKTESVHNLHTGTDKTRFRNLQQTPKSKLVLSRINEHSMTGCRPKSVLNLESTKKGCLMPCSGPKSLDLDSGIDLHSMVDSKTIQNLEPRAETNPDVKPRIASESRPNLESKLEGNLNAKIELTESFPNEETIKEENIISKIEFTDNFVSSTTDVPSTFSFTQFCNSSQILEQIEREIKTELGATDPMKIPNRNVSKPQPNFWDDTLNGAMETFTTTQYKKELDGIFQKVEDSIYDFGVNQDTTLAKNTTNLSNETINNVLEKTFKSPDGIKKAIQKAEETLKATTSQAWSDDSILADAVINMSVEGKSIAEIIKKALMQNVKKHLSQQQLFNSTLIEEEEHTEFKSFGSFYGLPDKVKDLMRLYKGIENLYEWQNECLNLPSIKARKNLIYALPTSGGKTLVAEILLLREVLCRKKNVLFILPFVAIVQEKVWSLSPFAVALEFLIEEYAAGKGNYPPRKRRRKNSVYIATIEKGLGLMNSLIETGRADEIGLVIVDELHLIGDRSRGSTLEELLTKIIYIKKNIQIIGMSATIGNLPELCEFLKADVYTKDFRPVELVEYVKCGDELAKVDWKSGCQDDILTFERKLNYKYAESLIKIDPDRLGGLVMDVVPKDSCLVFCRSKKNCENVAILLCKVVFENLKKYKAKEKESIKNALQEEAGSLCSILKTSITYGIAYHHSGLTSEERRIIEEGFRQGIISVICCTSTLAAGVNLPAKRVIIRNPYIGRDFINLSRYKQMVGRAGRAGLGELGESILISTPEELPKVQELLMSPMDIATSSMHEANARGLAHFLLSCISLKMAGTKSELQNVAATTLMGVQRERLGVDIKKLARAAIRSLFKMGALNVEGQTKKEGSEGSNEDVTLKLDTTIPLSNSTDSQSVQSVGHSKTVVNVGNDTKLEISKMGMAAIKGGLDLERAHILYEDLLQAQSSLVLFTGLHLMFLVTPYDLSEQVNPTNAHYYTLYSKLNIRELQTARVLGITEAVATKMLSNKKITEVPVRILNRFYVTLMLYDLWNEMSVYDVAIKYDINRGLIQNLMTSAASFASNVFHFCEEFEEFWAFSLLLKGMGDRLSHCCVRELIPLMKLPSVKQNRAKQLFQAGYKTLQSVAKADPQDLMESVEYMSKKLANQLIAAAKLILLERVENLREEAEDVLDGVEF